MPSNLSSAAAVLCLLASGSYAFIVPSGEAAGAQRSSSALHAERRDFFSQVATTVVGAGIVAGNVLGAAVEPANALGGGLKRVNARLGGCVSSWLYYDCLNEEIFIRHMLLVIK